MIVGQRERERDYRVEWGRSEVRVGAGRLLVGGQAVRQSDGDADGPSAGRTPDPAPPFGITTLGELVKRRSHHERPERRQGRLGPEKR